MTPRGWLGIVLVGTLALGGCPPTPPPIVVPPIVIPPVAPQPVRTVAVVVTDGSRPVVGATATLADEPPKTAQTDGNGYVAWFGVLASLTDSHLTIAAEGYLPYSQHVDVGLGDYQLPSVTLTPKVVALPRLVAVGQFLRLETGERWTAIEISDFNLLNRFLDGEDIAFQLRQRRDLGFTLLRVWTLYDLEPGIGRLTLNDHPDLYARIPAFLSLCARHGLYVEFTAYTSTEIPTHWDRLVQAVQPFAGRVLLELVNEGTLPVNQIDMSRYARPMNHLASHGSGGAEGVPPWEPWTLITFHTNGAFEEQRKVGHNAMELWSGPTLTNETSRFPEVGMWVRRNDESEPQWLARVQRLAYDSAAGGALLAAGSCFHCVHCKTSALLDAHEVFAATVWAAGARAVDLACQDGPYVHRSDLETSALLRVYERPVPTHSCLVEIRK